MLKPLFVILLSCFLADSAWSQRLLLSPADFNRINQQAQAGGWAATTRTAIITAAESWPAAYLTKYGLSKPEIPAEGGQWWHWYVCPTHGVRLKFTAPNRHNCPVDNRAYSGWPYDQVILAERQDYLAQAALDNGLAFQLTGNEAFATAAARLLVDYATIYPTYTLHDINNRNARSGARATAQTLDEAIWLINLAWAYDLVAGSRAWQTGERERVERDLLRNAVAVIQRNDMRESNWQSWHNTAIGAVGFALDDATLISQAIDGPSGFRFQLRQSVLGEGIWYEGAWGYHFYALDALAQLAEMAARNGVNLYAETNLRRLFETPLRLSFADLSLPAFNDTVSLNLSNYAYLYEMALARYGEPALAAIPGTRTRGREALFWGVPTLPSVSYPKLPSEIFAEAGYAALRAESNDHAVILKFGPHGGGHGHYDKLNFISFARGGVLAVDPGTQAYGAPTHDTWDKQTVAHNTLVVDERTQAEATGKLLWSWLQGPMTAARADAGEAYKNAALERTMYLTADYVLDVVEARATDGADHQFDWVYHNFGQAETALPLTNYTAFPASQGYQHLTGNRAAVTSEDWKLGFDAFKGQTVNYGSVFASTTAVKGSFQYSREQVSGGNFAGVVNYDLSGAGYLLYSTPVLSNQPNRKPAGLALMLFGDGSGNRLTLRLNDATDERFQTTVGPINWTGWRLVEVTDPEKWTHYLGNNDGVFDTPVRLAAVQLDPVATAAKTGKLFVDDITIGYGSNDKVLAADFELPLRNLRVWMLGASETTVVSGQGLGPDLLQPVPYVMARRRGRNVRFVTLLEPYGAAPRIVAFRELGLNAFSVTGPDFEDEFSVAGDGTLRYLRRQLGVRSVDTGRTSVGAGRGGGRTVGN